MHAGVTGSHSQMHHKMQISKEFSLNLNITLFHSLLLSPIGLKIYRWHQTLLHFKTIFQYTEFYLFLFNTLTLILLLHLYTSVYFKSSNKFSFYRWCNIFGTTLFSTPLLLLQNIKLSLYKIKNIYCFCHPL